MRWQIGTVRPNRRRLRARIACRSKDRSGNVRLDVWKRGDWRKQFTICIASNSEEPYVPLSEWLLALDLMCGNEMDVSAM